MIIEVNFNSNFLDEYLQEREVLNQQVNNYFNSEAIALHQRLTLFNRASPSIGFVKTWILQKRRAMIKILKQE